MVRLRNNPQMHAREQKVVIELPSTPFHRLKLVIEGVPHAEVSAIIRIFINVEHSIHLLVDLSNPHFLGSVYRYGYGEALQDMQSTSNSGNTFRAIIKVSEKNYEVIRKGNYVTLLFLEENENGELFSSGAFSYGKVFWKTE